jgi:hypothetical protein
MNVLEFEQLCRDASLELGIDDIEALGQGFSMQYANVPFEAAFRTGRESFQLTAELGAVTAPCRVNVYENLLTIQLMTWDRSGIRFGFNPDRQTVVVCSKVTFGPQLDAPWLAMVIRSLAAQATEWRRTLLAGDFGDCEGEDDDNKVELSLADYLAQRI